MFTWMNKNNVCDFNNPNWIFIFLDSSVVFVHANVATKEMLHLKKK